MATILVVNGNKVAVVVAALIGPALGKLLRHHLRAVIVLTTAVGTGIEHAFTVDAAVTCALISIITFFMRSAIAGHVHANTVHTLLTSRTGNLVVAPITIRVIIRAVSSRGITAVNRALATIITLSIGTAAVWLADNLAVAIAALGSSANIFTSSSKLSLQPVTVINISTTGRVGSSRNVHRRQTHVGIRVAKLNSAVIVVTLTLLITSAAVRWGNVSGHTLVSTNRGLQALTALTRTGGVLWACIRAGIGVTAGLNVLALVVDTDVLSTKQPVITVAAIQTFTSRTQTVDAVTINAKILHTMIRPVVGTRCEAALTTVLIIKATVIIGHLDALTLTAERVNAGIVRHTLIVAGATAIDPNTSSIAIMDLKAGSSGRVAMVGGTGIGIGRDALIVINAAIINGLVDTGTSVEVAVVAGTSVSIVTLNETTSGGPVIKQIAAAIINSLVDTNAAGSTGVTSTSRVVITINVIRAARSNGAAVTASIPVALANLSRLGNGFTVLIAVTALLAQSGLTGVGALIAVVTLALVIGTRALRVILTAVVNLHVTNTLSIHARGSLTRTRNTVTGRLALRLGLNAAAEMANIRSQHTIITASSAGAVGATYRGR